MKVFLALLVVVAFSCLALGDETLIRVAHYEPVIGFSLNAAKDYVSFNAYGKKWEFTLSSSDLTDNEADNEGHYFGRQLNVDTSYLSSFTIVGDFVSAMIESGNDTFWLEARDPTKPTELFIHRTSDVWFHPSVRNINCQHPGHQSRNPADKAEEGHLDARSTYKCTMYTDQYWLSPANNPSWYTSAGTLALLNDVNVVYVNSGLGGWSFSVGGKVGNQYTQESQKNAMLTYFSNLAQSRGYTSSGRSAHWLVGHNVGGLAWLGSTCNAYGAYYKTGVSGLAYWSRLYTVKTIAHELGHNRGANHDFNSQCGANQATGCQCSIMSYCFPTASTYGGARNYWTSKSIKEIKGSCA